MEKHNRFMAELRELLDRRDQLRAPGLPMGLCLNGVVPVSSPGDFELHWKWLENKGLAPEEEESDE